MSASLAATLVTVMLDGMPLDASTAAFIDRGRVVAPLDPFVRAIADRIEDTPGGVRIVRGKRSIVVRIGSNVARDGTITQPLPMAPYLRAGLTIIPLAAIARALGGMVRYERTGNVLRIDVEPSPIEGFTPVPYVPPPAGSVPTFAPRATPAPRETVSGIPKPRRTPILVEDPAAH